MQRKPELLRFSRRGCMRGGEPREAIDEVTKGRTRRSTTGRLNPYSIWGEVNPLQNETQKRPIEALDG